MKLNVAHLDKVQLRAVGVDCEECYSRDFTAFGKRAW